ncbi:MAG TPA: flagellar type III secretion system pore protein FliP [Planctomycetota bacterium]|nr:flagellar type III secretion system pore protein FliP [Planctomycetota bacterium]
MRALLLLLLALLAAALPAQAPAAPIGPPAAPQGPALSVQLTGGAAAPDNVGGALEILLLMTLLSLAPAIVLTMTSFTRIVIVLSFLKRAMAMQELPPAPVVTGFAVFLTLFIMKPVATDLHAQAFRPYVERQISLEEASSRAGARLNRFMLKQTRPEDIALILELSGTPRPNGPEDVPFHVAVPAFVLSEMKTAFQMGFVLFLPFVVIDLVISSLLVSMGMFTLPPVVVSTPLKLLLFILVDGWDLVVRSLAESFVET